MNSRKISKVVQLVFILMVTTLSFYGIVQAEEAAEDMMIKSEETWQKWNEVISDPAIREIIEYRDSINIPKDEPFKSGKAGITWEEFQNLERRQLTDAEIAELKKAVEQSKFKNTE